VHREAALILAIGPASLSSRAVMPTILRRSVQRFTPPADFDLDAFWQELTRV